MSTSSPDLVIVGAGAAGLAAARAARAAGVETVLLEATPRIGGRAWTETRTFGVPWDRGCHWLHSADINPFTPLADAYGFSYRSGRVPWKTFRAGAWLSDADESAADVAIDATMERIIAAGNVGDDRPLSHFASGDATWVGMFETSVHAEWGFGLDSVSTLDVARYHDTHHNWPVREGYGALVARHNVDVDVTLATPVTRIEWSGKRAVVHTPAGNLDAAAVLVTVSTGVLGAGTIEFDPPLPAWKLAAIEAVPLGRDNKAAFHVRGGLPDVDGQLSADIPFGPASSISVHVHPFETELVSLYLGEPTAAQLEELDPREAIAALVEAVVAVFGSELRDRIGASTITAWGKEPYVLGAYAATRPGLAHLRHDLATSIENRLYFAGEATSPEFFTTCHGAHLSGIAAVSEIRDHLQQLAR